MTPNLALNLAPFSRWTLRDKAAQRRLTQLPNGRSSAFPEFYVEPNCSNAIFV
jgi:hypothetical protein